MTTSQQVSSTVMEKNKLRENILSEINRLQRGISFAELARIKGFTGNFEWFNSKWNVVYWTQMSEEAIEIMQDLCDERKITVRPAHWLVYFIDGLVPKRYPIAKSARSYKKTRWLPIVFDKIHNQAVNLT
ncbi:MAG: hypothetical protein ACFFG0_05440 [Candidatus Thorarchaeota archaeon]